MIQIIDITIQSSNIGNFAIAVIGKKTQNVCSGLFINRPFSMCVLKVRCLLSNTVKSILLSKVKKMSAIKLNLHSEICSRQFLIYCQE